jgi:D-cysteine desulfhydrase
VRKNRHGRVELGTRPTPVRRLDRLSEEGAAEVWVKDDGQFAGVGTKGRKLEWLLADARRRGKRTVMTGGAIATNHGLATARYAAELGMDTTLVLVPNPSSERTPERMALLRASGARLHLPRGKRRAQALVARLMLQEAATRRSIPYYIAPGGSHPLGCVGLVEAGLELADQVSRGELPEPSHVVAAVASGGTAAGLSIGMKLGGLRSRLVGVLVNPSPARSRRAVARLHRRTQSLLRRTPAILPDIDLGGGRLRLESDWIEANRLEPDSVQDAMGLLARDGVTLDPVYTGKAVAGLRDLAGRGAFSRGPVLYWHSYGGPPQVSSGG